MLKMPGPRVPDVQLCQLIRSAAGCKADFATVDPIGVLSSCYDDGYLELPVLVESVFVVPYRLPVFGDIRLSPAQSFLRNQIDARSLDTCLVVDSLRSGKESLLLVRAFDSQRTGNMEVWVTCLNPQTAFLTFYAKHDITWVIASLTSYKAQLSDA